MFRLILFLTSFLFFIVPGVASEGSVSADAIANTTVSDTGGNDNRATLIRAAILLDRAHFSPGIIDGLDGANVQNAIRAYQSANGLSETGTLNSETMRMLTSIDTDEPLIEYTISEDDVNGPFTEKIPAKMEQQSELSRLGYRDSTELLAEKFHMSEELLKAMNNGKRFNRAGTKLMVPNVRREQKGLKAAKLEVNKTNRVLRAFDSDGKLVAHYPASIGSEETPAPSGIVKVTRIAKNPSYTYNPEYEFQGVKSKKTFTIKPGPNNPVGLVWIALEGDGYGIHGTPDPEKVAKTASHGCLRLTNWDALELSAMIEKDIPVNFIN